MIRQQKLMAEERKEMVSNFESVLTYFRKCKKKSFSREIS